MGSSLEPPVETVRSSGALLSSGSPYVIKLHRLLTNCCMSHVELSFSEKQTAGIWPFSWFLNLPSVLLKTGSFGR